MKKLLIILICCLALASCEDDSQKNAAQRRVQHPRPSVVRSTPPGDEPAVRPVAQRPKAVRRQIRPEQAQEPEPYIPPVYATGQDARIGSFTYRIGRAFWLNTEKHNIRETPKGSFLCVPVYVRNDDMEPAFVPDIQLVDENGALYDSKMIYGNRTLDQFDTNIKLNPQLAEEGILIFDVPRDHDYVVKIPGRLFGGKYAFVDLQQ